MRDAGPDDPVEVFRAGGAARKFERGGDSGLRGVRPEIQPFKRVRDFGGFDRFGKTLAKTGKGLKCPGLEPEQFRG